MKIFRFFGVAVAALCMCMNFTACSSDDGSDGGGGSINEKKLTKIVLGEETYTTFSYDNQGRVIEVVDSKKYESSKEVHTYQYIWGDNAVVVNKQTQVVNPDGYTEKSSSSYEYDIENGLVQSNNRNEDIETFYYNNSNRLSQIKSRWYTDDYLWDGDKLVVIDNSIKLTYKKSCSKGYSPIFVEGCISSEPLLIAHPEIIGVRTKQLPATVTTTWNDGQGYGEQTVVVSYSYTFDNEGYISKIEINEEKITYTLTWE